MTAVDTTLRIVCPDWCVVDPQEHADELWNMGGVGVHRSAVAKVEDPSGYQEAMTETRFHSPVDLCMTGVNTPDGRETASPILYLEGKQMSLEQATGLGAKVAAMVDTYKAAKTHAEMGG